MATEKAPISIVLLGKTGQGKSATGNTLLGTYRFEEGGNLMAETKVVVNYTVDYSGYKLKIFDTPGHVDAEKNDFEYINFTLENMDKLMQICDGRNEFIGAFLLVINCQDRFSAEDKETIAAFETIFGNDFLQKHCIIVITKGDCLKEKLDVWLKQQSGPFVELIKKCENRVHLVCNKDKEIINNYKETDNEYKDKVGERQKSREEIINAVLALRRKYPLRYSCEEYKSYAKNRYQMLLKSELEPLFVSYNEQLSKIMRKRTVLKNKKDRDSLLKEIAVLRFTIEEKDKGTGMLKTFLDSLAREEELVPSMDICTLS